MGDLTGTLFLSNKRKKLLLFLKNGVRTWDEIKTNLNVTASGMLPQIHVLENEGLIIRSGKKYRLSDQGMLIVHFMEPLVSTIESLENNKNFWKEHNISAIPLKMLQRLSELKNTSVTECSIEESFEPHTHLLDNIEKSFSLKGISPIVNPMYPHFFLNGAKQGKNVSLILTRNAFEKIGKDYSPYLEEGLQYGNAALYVYHGNIRFASFVTEVYFSLSLFYHNEAFDSIRDLVSTDPSAIAWGNDLFSHYLALSERITQYQLTNE
ncbi:helix-turn-helix transcriptional regulator [Methanofollis fontis]|uniref:Transcriptional regulator n=1 Tax=Methanofollis fontis TaxID=2052832 RepID=A0A483CS94_9EURY|nr:winged helix-turn-helix domain-containing protein [Methanofollis fontis]TAJ45728.1 transcriptional regulator [Methanofollis fontis]